MIIIIINTGNKISTYFTVTAHLHNIFSNEKIDYLLHSLDNYENPFMMYNSITEFKIIVLV